jgi:hypothetical protein
VSAFNSNNSLAMAEQSYFSLTPDSIYSTSYQQDTATHKRSTSAKHRAFMRQLLSAWCPPVDTPPSSRAVSFSSWTHVTDSKPTTPFGELKASELCRGSGTTPTYDPPAHEWTYLGAEQPPLRCGKPSEKRTGRRRQEIDGSWTTTTSASENGQASAPTTFRKQAVKRVSTESQLTSSLRLTTGKQLTSRFGLQGLACEDLPSAFDSDSEDEEET